MNKFDIFEKQHYPNCLISVNEIKDIIKGSTIIDVGSNIGLFAKAVAENVEYESIHLFEPSIELIQKSKQILNSYSKIYFNPVGLGNIACEKVLYKNKGSNLGWNTFLKQDPHQSEGFYNSFNTEYVKIVKLDEYYKDIIKLDFIKIDVEGYERQVLEGSMNTISKFKPFLFIEVAWGMNHPEWRYNLQVYNKLFDIGYKKINFHVNNTQDLLFIPN